ncbi:LPS export ABC transporter periplasmic protein LptC [Bacterioplanoides sp.]|uniref:LPS export ABC transporter periplasmic protein LptC n=1 Tax=Bacterioplanoides sp. TaxID=2066072 RepID=UPI003B00E8F8
MRKRYLLLVLTILLGFALLAVDNYTQEASAPLTENQTAEADYYGEILFNRRFNEQGALEQSFSAQRSTHFPTTQDTVFDGPVIHIQDEDGSYWQVQAQLGTMNDQDDLLRLRQDVEIRPLKRHSSATDEVVINTSSLDYLTKQQVAQTTEPVTIVNPQTQITATGMRMDLKTQRMELHSEVTTHHAPE